MEFNPFARNMAERRVKKLAKELGFTGFSKSFNLYQKSLPPPPKREEQEQIAAFHDDMPTMEISLPDRKMRICLGSWHIDEHGVWMQGPFTPIIACSHVILPVAVIENISTKFISYRLAFRRGNDFGWQFFEIGGDDMASPTELTRILARRGVSISGGDRAKNLANFLRDMVDLNISNLPNIRSFSRLGWIEDEDYTGFFPYIGGTEFDKTADFENIYKDIQQKGALAAWLKETIAVRKFSSTAKIVIAASFASPLIKPLGTMPFFLHLWSVGSGTGKSVAQMVAASVWGNPNIGDGFFKTFQGTNVGMEILAGFLHSIPLFLDELQLTKDSHGNIQFSVYRLASGSGKLRSNKNLGINGSITWNNCFITSGETPLVKDTDGEGALNRVIEIECYADQKVIKNGRKTASVVRLNYGHAGKIFIDNLCTEEGKQRALELYEKFYSACLENHTTEKQAMSASTILVADALATEWIFKDDNALTVSEISEFLKSNDKVSLMRRCYESLCGWVGINANKFRGIQPEERGECFGLIDAKMKCACIIRPVFDKWCADNEVSPRGFLSHLRTNNLIITRGKGYTMSRYLGSHISQNCVYLRMDEYLKEMEQEQEESKLEVEAKADEESRTVEDLPF